MPLDQYIDQLQAQINVAYQRYALLAERCSDRLGSVAKPKTADRRRNQMLAAKTEWRALEERLQALLDRMTMVNAS